MSRRGTHITVSLSVPVCLSTEPGTSHHHPQDTRHKFNGFLSTSWSLSLSRVPSITMGSVKGGRGRLLSSLREEAIEMGQDQKPFLTTANCSFMLP